MRAHGENSEHYGRQTCQNTSKIEKDIMAKTEAAIKVNSRDLTNKIMATTEIMLDKFTKDQSETTLATEQIAVCKNLRVATVEYKQGHFVVLYIDRNTGFPTFGKIATFVSLAGDDCWHVVVERVQTEDFVFHLHSYEVMTVQPCVYLVHRPRDLADHHPLYCHSMFVGPSKKQFVRLPYHIL